MSKVAKPTRPKMILQFSDSNQARRFAAMAVARVPTAGLGLADNEVTVEHDDQDGKALHRMAALVHGRTASMMSRTPVVKAAVNTEYNGGDNKKVPPTGAVPGTPPPTSNQEEQNQQALPESMPKPALPQKPIAPPDPKTPPPPTSWIQTLHFEWRADAEKALAMLQQAGIKAKWDGEERVKVKAGKDPKTRKAIGTVLMKLKGVVVPNKIPVAASMSGIACSPARDNGRKPWNVPGAARPGQHTTQPSFTSPDEQLPRTKLDDKIENAVDIAVLTAAGAVAAGAVISALAGMGVNAVRKGQQIWATIKGTRDDQAVNKVSHMPGVVSVKKSRSGKRKPKQQAASFSASAYTGGNHYMYDVSWQHPFYKDTDILARGHERQNEMPKQQALGLKREIASCLKQALAKYQAQVDFGYGAGKSSFVIVRSFVAPNILGPLMNNALSSKFPDLLFKIRLEHQPAMNRPMPNSFGFAYNTGIVGNVACADGYPDDTNFDVSDEGVGFRHDPKKLSKKGHQINKAFHKMREYMDKAHDGHSNWMVQQFLRGNPDPPEFKSHAEAAKWHEAQAKESEAHEKRFAESAAKSEDKAKSSWFNKRGHEEDAHWDRMHEGAHEAVKRLHQTAARYYKRNAKGQFASFSHGNVACEETPTQSIVRLVVDFAAPYLADQFAAAAKAYGFDVARSSKWSLTMSITTLLKSAAMRLINKYHGTVEKTIQQVTPPILQPKKPREKSPVFRQLKKKSFVDSIKVKDDPFTSKRRSASFAFPKGHGDTMPILWYFEDEKKAMQVWQEARRLGMHQHIKIDTNLLVPGWTLGGYLPQATAKQRTAYFLLKRMGEANGMEDESNHGIQRKRKPSKKASHVECALPALIPIGWGIYYTAATIGNIAMGVELLKTLKQMFGDKVKVKSNGKKMLIKSKDKATQQRIDQIIRAKGGQAKDVTQQAMSLARR